MKRMILIATLLLVAVSLSLVAAQCGGAAPIPTQPAETAAPGAQPTKPGGASYPAPGTVQPTTSSAPTAQPSQPAATAKPAGYPAGGLTGESLLNERCTVCHTLDRVKSAKKTPAEWQTTVERMIGHGAKLSDSEKAILLEYLAATYK